MIQKTLAIKFSLSLLIISLLIVPSRTKDDEKIHSELVDKLNSIKQKSSKYEFITKDEANLKKDRGFLKYFSSFFSVKIKEFNVR